MATLLHKESLCSRAVAKEHILPAAELAGGLSGWSASCVLAFGSEPLVAEVSR